MKSALSILALAFLLAAPLRAGVEIAFAVPDDGRITLGVFDSAGHLVRILHDLSRQEDFRIGLNGLITSWDGKDDSGRSVPAGRYHVRGYLIGEEVRVEGEDFLFNDFATDTGFPGFSRILDFSMLNDGELLLLASNGAAPLLARLSTDSGFVWSKPVPAIPPDGRPKLLSFRTVDAQGHPLGASVMAQTQAPPAPPLAFEPMLATNTSSAVVLSGGGCVVSSLSDGTPSLSFGPGGGSQPLAIAANDRSLLISSEGGLTEVPLKPDAEEQVTSPPARFTAMDADAHLLVGASPDGLWLRRQAFEKLNIPAVATSVSIGSNGTIWFVGQDSGSLFVAQATPSGEILRTWRPDAGDPVPHKIRASRESERFAVLESAPGVQRLRVMSRSDAGEWTIDWEHTIRDFSAFGYLDGKPVPDAGSSPGPQELRFHLNENPLTGQRDFLTIRAESTPAGSRLVSPDGLPLVRISNREDILRLVIHRGSSPGSLSLLQGNASFVEEFSISGLDDILPLDAGDVDLP